MDGWVGGSFASGASHPPLRMTRSTNVIVRSFRRKRRDNP